jgi:hypothetical protein
MVHSAPSNEDVHGTYEETTHVTARDSSGHVVQRVEREMKHRCARAVEDGNNDCRVVDCGSWEIVTTGQY